MKKVILVGTDPHVGGFIDAITSSGDEVMGFLAEDPSLKEFYGFPVLGTCADYEKFPDAEFLIACGDPKDRKRLDELCSGAKWYTAVHPRAYISKINVSIGEGSFIMPDAIINPGSKVGRHVIVNSTVVVDLENEVGDYCHLSVGCKCAGSVKIGSLNWVGIGAVINAGASICDGNMIGAGTVVVKSITEQGVYVGSPARKIK